MRDNFQDKLRLFLRHRIPLVTTLMMMFVFFVPLNVLDVNYFRPSVGMICVYYWTLKRGYMFSYISAFVVGFLMDAYSAVPLGVNILMMMLLVFATDMLARYFRAASFVGSWLVFALTSLSITLVKWLLVSIYFARFIPMSEIMISLITTIMFYPLIAYVNIWIQNNWLTQERINE